jgi:RHS repeat-associated protein
VYDALNRLTHKGYPDATGVDYVYDLAGKIKQVTDPTGTYGFAYDNMGRLIGTTTQYAFLPGTPPPTFSNSYAYDVASNRTTFTAPDGSTNTYAYDTLNRLSTLTDSGAGQFTMGYDALSRRTQLTRPNGITTSYGYDPVSHLQSILHKLGVNTLDGATYAYDLAGNRTSKTNQLNSTVSNYGYDNIYQLTGVTQGASSTEAYTFDFVGNRLSSLAVPSYSYNSSNEITAAGSSAYAYDNDGNTLTKVDGTGTTTYTWDFENRLTSVHPPGQTTVTFKYDPFGKRIQKGGSVYVYDGANLIEEADNTGNLAARYVFGFGADEPLATYLSGTWEFYQADGLGSITSLSTLTGTISDNFVYDSLGNVISSAGTFTQPFRYTGREWDTETGLYYYRARYYDATTGRFLSEDPTDFDGGVDFYTYVGNDPVNWTDPLGLERMGYGDIANLVATHNRSGQSNELIICMIYKESTFDPDASQPGSNSARGLMGVTDSAATQMGDNWEDLGDPAANIVTGSGYLGWRIHRNHGNVRNGLWGYGTGQAYADSLLKCEKCLIGHATASIECKTKDCLEPLHVSTKPKHHPKSRPHHPKKPKL